MEVILGDDERPEIESTRFVTANPCAANHYYFYFEEWNLCGSFF